MPVVKKAAKKVAKKAVLKKPAGLQRRPKLAAKPVAKVEPRVVPAPTPPVQDYRELAARVAAVRTGPLILRREYDAATPAERRCGFHIYDPKEVKFVERDAFMQALVGSFGAPPMPLEDQVNMQHSVQAKYGYQGKKVVIDRNTLELAHTFIQLRDKGARLPGFGRWAAGMFRDNEAMNKTLAEVGQIQGGARAQRTLHISTDMVDILRCADSPGFSSCFAYCQMEQEQPKNICEMTPGIAILYSNREDGKMAGRVFLYHGKIVATGEDVVVYYCKNIAEREVKDLLTSFGIKAYKATPPYSLLTKNTPGAVEVEFVNCFKDRIYHDVQCWGKVYLL